MERYGGFPRRAIVAASLWTLVQRVENVVKGLRLKFWKGDLKAGAKAAALLERWGKQVGNSPAAQVVVLRNLATLFMPTGGKFWKEAGLPPLDLNGQIQSILRLIPRRKEAWATLLADIMGPDHARSLVRSRKTVKNLVQWLQNHIGDTGHKARFEAWREGAEK